jgi:hypothetical protein
MRRFCERLKRSKRARLELLHHNSDATERLERARWPKVAAFTLIRRSSLSFFVAVVTAHMGGTAREYRVLTHTHDGIPDVAGSRLCVSYDIADSKPKPRALNRFHDRIRLRHRFKARVNSTFRFN